MLLYDSTSINTCPEQVSAFRSNLFPPLGSSTRTLLCPLRTNHSHLPRPPAPCDLSQHWHQAPHGALQGQPQLHNGTELLPQVLQPEMMGVRALQGTHRAVTAPSATVTEPRGGCFFQPWLFTPWSSSSFEGLRHSPSLSILSTHPNCSQSSGT